MDAAQARHQHRTFARTNGLGGAAAPHLVAAEERHRQNVQHLRQLKAALCSTVSSAAPRRPTAPISREESLPSSSSPSLPALGASRSQRTGVVASATTTAAYEPPPAKPLQHSAPLAAVFSTETALSAAVLRGSQREVEQLIREKHQLQQQCIELASLLAKETPGKVPSSLMVATPEGSLDPFAWSPVHDAALAVMAQVTRCFPNVVEDWTTAKATNDAVPTNSRTDPKRLRSAAPSRTAANGGPQGNAEAVNGMLGDVADISADELIEGLHRLAAFLPQLACMTTVSELIAEAGPDMLDHIHTLEEEKRNDCRAVLSITDHLTEVTAQLRQEAAEKDAALRAMGRTVEELMEEKQEWSRRARASEAALAERYTQYRQREKAWEQEVAALLQSRDAVASAAAAPAVQGPPVTTAEVEANVEDAAAAERAAAAEVKEWTARLAQLQEVLDKKTAALESFQQEHMNLQSTHATLQASSQETVAAQQEHIAALERQLQPLEAEVQMQADAIRATLHKVDELTAAHRAEVAALNTAHTTALQEKEAAFDKLQAARAHVETELADATAKVEQRTAELQAMTAARDAAQTALEERDRASVADSSSFLVPASTPLRLLRPDFSGVDVSESRDGVALDEKETGESPSTSGNGDNDESADAISRCTNVRKLQQSLKRMSRERTALKRKLEHRGAALTEMETELEAAQRLVAQHEARIQVLETDIERAEISAVRGSSVAPEPTQTAASVVPLRWFAFSELEEHAEEGTLYPAPVDLSGWLREDTAPLRFKDYAAQHLSPHDQLLLDAVGPLYHVGFNLLRAEGLLGDGLYFPVIWRRFLLQLQQTLDVQLQGLPLSPADTARCFYALASTAGLFKRQSDRHDPLDAYTLIVASLCVCLRPRDADEDAAVTTGSTPKATQQTDTVLAALAQKTSVASCFASKWRCCRAILRHICDQGDGEDETSRRLHSVVTEGAATPYALFAKLAQQDAAAVFSPASDSDVSTPRRELRRDNRWEEEAVSPTCNLASLLSHGLLSDVLPISRLSLQVAALQLMAKAKAEIGEGRYGVDSAAEHRLLSTAAASRLTPSQHLLILSLLLYLSRYEYLLCGWRTMMTAAVTEEKRMDAAVLLLPSLEALGVHRGLSFSDVKVDLRGRTQAENAMEALLVLDAGLLPAITMCICMCRTLEHEPRLLPDYYATRRALMDLHKESLALDDAMPALSLAERCPRAPPLLLLSEAQLRDYVQQVLSPVKCTPSVANRVVQVPSAEYERLHRELLSLYQTNETNEAYIQELLDAVEAM
ncbi:hypothetical protein ABB37_09521 [Leptomonas pyrrhocoris]|uniref:Uncharacterized protein n=1 Tax=Leptomonas pyrrhocoris TaxID=157538 RepID=A0A0N0VCZ6_LEPPY|nr:hypothetical protein ABB37_09521 [Leptomonas pyrrhocoris]KPA73924.1 hypothetical protein ABB37_09521 [Leptomonas pyrrhocoris]|eukprot:XP_015652363.1 hypothetical protein ABB37_09521 [Leptomonas pyrrhocoris]